VRDVTLAEDASTIRTGAAPQVMASLKNTVLNLHRLAGAANIAEACRVTAFSADRGLNMLTEHRKHPVTGALVNNAGALSGHPTLEQPPSLIPRKVD